MAVSNRELPVRFEWCMERTRVLRLRGNTWFVSDNGQPEIYWSEARYQDLAFAAEIERLQSQLAEAAADDRLLYAQLAAVKESALKVTAETKLAVAQVLLREIYAKSVRNKHNLHWHEVTLTDDQMASILKAAGGGG